MDGRTGGWQTRRRVNGTWGTAETSFLGGVAGAAGVGAVRMGATLVNTGAAGTAAMVETIAGASAVRAVTLVVNPTGNVVRGAGAVAGGIASGAMKTATATRNEAPALSFEPQSGNQSLSGFATLPGQTWNYGYMGGGGAVILPK